jgi:hypothetical protein
MLGADQLRNDEAAPSLLLVACDAVGQLQAASLQLAGNMQRLACHLVDLLRPRRRMLDVTASAGAPSAVDRARAHRGRDGVIH